MAELACLEYSLDGPDRNSPNMKIRIAASLAVVALVTSSVASASVPRGPSRASVDRPDATAAPQVHVVYFVPKDSADQRRDIDGSITRGLERMNGWMAADSRLRWRFDRLRSGGGLDVSFVRGGRSNADYKNGSASVLDSVKSELSARGFDAANKRYLIFYGGDTKDSPLCGSAQYPIYAARQYTPARDAVLLGGKTAIVFLKASTGCHSGEWGHASTPGWAEGTSLHELLHTEGLVAPGAPHACDPVSGHVCGFGPATTVATQLVPLDPEERDVLFPYVRGPLSELQLDRGHDDYVNSPISRLDLRDSAFVDGGSFKPSDARSGTALQFSEMNLLASPLNSIHLDRRAYCSVAVWNSTV